MEMPKKQIVSLIDSSIAILLGLFIVVFPLISFSLTTDFFGLPKQALLGAISLFGLLLFGVRTLYGRDIKARSTPFNLPVIAFCLTALLSVFFAVNRFDALINSVPLLFSVILYFLIINFLKKGSSLFFALSSLVVSGVIVSLLAILSFFRIYFLPFSFTQVQTFTPMGSLLDSGLFLLSALGVTVPCLWSILSSLTNTHARTKLFTDSKTMLLLAGSVIITIGLTCTIFELVAIQKPNILPLKTGFQTGFAAISQDANRILPGFLLGSGYGTYSTVFTRFRQPDFNLSADVWALTFFRSSNFFLELLATTGVLGIISYLTIIGIIAKELRKINVASNENPFAISLLFLAIGSFLLPFSPTMVTILFLTLGLFAASQGLSKDSEALGRFFDVELHLIAFKKNLAKTSLYEGLAKFLPLTVFILFFGMSTILGYYSIRFIASDVLFEKSAVATASNLASATYDYQNKAIGMFYYRDAYHRAFSQTNLAVASFLAEQQQQDPSSTKNIDAVYTLTQQSINSARTATQIAPQTVANWTNLSSIYRSLIGFGQQAEQFAILANQQAIALDPSNPQGYLNLGGIYYQLGQWENAQRQFQIAISLKPDYANAYYNLGHALESKGELKEALNQYLTVKSLTEGDPQNKERVQQEIDALQARLDGQVPNNTPASSLEENTSTSSAQLDINSPERQLPQRNPQLKIPALDTESSQSAEKEE